MTSEPTQKKFLIWDNTQESHNFGNHLVINFIKVRTPVLFKLLRIKHFKWKAVGHIMNYQIVPMIDMITSEIEKRFPKAKMVVRIIDHSDYDSRPVWGEVKFYVTFSSEADEAEFIFENNLENIIEKVSSISSLKIP